jgi:hypothetical protein
LPLNVFADITTDLTTETSKNKTNDDRYQLQSHDKPTYCISMRLPQRIEEQGLLQKRLTTYGQRSSSDSGRNINEDKLAETRGAIYILHTYHQIS